MFNSMESRITFEIPSPRELESLAFQHNYTVFLDSNRPGRLMEGEAGSAQEAEQYEQLLADVWVGVVLTLMVLSCVCCMCSCLLYHKFQQWKRSVLEARATADISSIEHGLDNESLPSYTLVSGLPSYDEAVRQLQQIKQMTNTATTNENKTTLEQQVQQHSDNAWTPSTPTVPARLSVVDLFHLYKASQSQLPPTSTNIIPVPANQLPTQTNVAAVTPAPVLTTVNETEVSTIQSEASKLS